MGVLLPSAMPHTCPIAAVSRVGRGQHTHLDLIHNHNKVLLRIQRVLVPDRRIINVSSVHEDLAMPTNSPYCAAKGGLRMLTRKIAVELAPNITVNNIAPGAIETPMDAKLEQDPDQMGALLSEIPLGRMGKPEEVASLAHYLLASDASAYTTGGTLFVDGGMIRRSGTL